MVTNSDYYIIYTWSQVNLRGLSQLLRARSQFPPMQIQNGRCNIVIKWNSAVFWQLSLSQAQGIPIPSREVCVSICSTPLFISEGDKIKENTKYDQIFVNDNALVNAFLSVLSSFARLPCHLC